MKLLARAVLVLILAPLAAAPADAAQDEGAKPPPLAHSNMPGTAAEAIRYPYVAAFSRGTDQNRVYFCVGTLVAPRWILTAAHCFHAPGGRRIPNDDLWAEVGRDRLHATPESAQVRVARVVVHPDYDSGSQANDLALVELDEIAGPLIAEVGAGTATPQRATVLGFGSFYEGELAGEAMSASGAPTSQTSDSLRQAEARPLDPARCAALLGTGGLGPRRLCASGGRRDTCVGDSGGPLVVPSQEANDRLVGIVSLGSGCAVEDPVVVYTRVGAYAGWIAATIGAH